MAAANLGSKGFTLGQQRDPVFMCPACFQPGQQIPAGDFQRVSCAYCGEPFSVAFLVLGDFVQFEEAGRG